MVNWKTRHGQAREVLLNTFEDIEFIKVNQLHNVNEIWNRLSDEYGTISDLKYTKPEADFRSLVKNQTQL